MERTSAPPKKKKKKDSQSSTKGAAVTKKSQPPNREVDDKQAVVTNRNYAYISPETISKIAESVGIAGLSDDISVNLAEDVSYKLQEIIHTSCTIMRRCKRRKLLTSDVATALQMSDSPPVLGHSGDEPFNYLYIPEAEVYVGEDVEVDLRSAALKNEHFTQPKPTYIANSWPVMENVSRVEEDKNSTFAVPHSKPIALNGELKSEESSEASCHPGERSNHIKNEHKLEDSPRRSKWDANSSLRDDSNQVNSSPKSNGSIMSSLKMENRCNSQTEVFDSNLLENNASGEKLNSFLSRVQCTYYNVVANCILQGRDSHFKLVVSDLRTNEKLGMIVVPLLNLVAHAVNHVPRHFTLISRILDVTDALLCNQFINPSFSLAVNRVVNALLAVASDRHMVTHDDFLLRKRSAHVLSKVLAEWNVEEEHVYELLTRVALVVGDTKEPSQSQYGALVIFQQLGQPVFLKFFLPLLTKYLPQFESQISRFSRVHVEEIRGVILNAVELLHTCDISTKSGEVIQALVKLDSLIYQHLGDAVCARRRTSICPFPHFTSEKLANSENQSGKHLSTRSLSNIRFGSSFRNPVQNRKVQSDIFHQAPYVPATKRKDIHFRFAGAIPVSKERLKRRALDSSHAQFVPHIHGPLLTLFYNQGAMVGKKRNQKTTSSPPFYNLFTNL